MTETEINLLLGTYGDHIRRYDVMIPNCYLGHDNECDLLAIRKSGFADEFEIKCSRSDFLADRKKRVQYREPTRDEYLNGGGWHSRNDTDCPWTMNKLEWLATGDSPINHFWYVTTEGLIQADDLPEFAGWIEVLSDSRLRIKRSPQKLSRAKMDFETRFKLARKASYRYWDMRRKAA
jgi:hypothetical protein